MTDTDAQRFIRQSDIVKPEELKIQIIIIGQGGIGGPAALALSKMGCSLIMTYDKDKFEAHNIPNQLCREDDIGKPKAEAVREIVKDFTGVEIDARNEEYKDQPLSGIVIAAVDSMKTRKIIWENVKSKPQVKLFIDARMGGEVARICSINPCDMDDVEFYEKTFYSDEEAEEMSCTARSVIYNVFGLAAYISVLVKKKVKGERLPKEIIIDFSKPVLVVSDLPSDKDKKRK